MLRNIIILLLALGLPIISFAQLTEIEGRLSVYEKRDSLTMIVAAWTAARRPIFNEDKLMFLGIQAGQLSDGKELTYIGRNAGMRATGSTNVFLGENAGYESNGSDNLFVGREAGYSNDGSRNTIIGGTAGIELNKQGGVGDNVVVGFNAGQLAENGSYNVFMGSFSGVENRGDYNNYIGYRSATRRNSGKQNVAIGAFSLNTASTGGDQNVAIGDSAMYDADNDGEIEGFKNAAVGASSLFTKRLFYSRNSAALGFEAGYDGGRNSIFLGYQAGKDATDLTNTLYISNKGGDNPLIYGDFEDERVEIEGSMHISKFARIKPIPTVDRPGCTSENFGTVYYDSDDNKLKVCTQGADRPGWVNLH